MRPVGDDHVDGRQVEAQQCVEPRRTNPPIRTLERNCESRVCFLTLFVFVILFEVQTEFSLSTLCWCFVRGGTPVLIPNTAVKPSRADGTRKGRVGRRQHRLLKTTNK